MPVTVFRPKPYPPELRISEPTVVDVAVLDHDGAHLGRITRKAWPVCGAATVDFVATCRTVRNYAEEGEPPYWAVKLYSGEIAGMRATNTLDYYIPR